ncbi:MAG: glycosyltransferase [Acidobacteria bacterium]|nr:glycosyltransferase [Acidobacteriota bacterium]
MTTLHLTNAYHPSSGGIRTFYTALLEAADRDGRRAVLVVPGERSRVHQVGRHARIYELAAPRALAFDRRYRLLLPHRYLPWAHTDLLRILEREQPQVVEICDKYALPYLAALLRKGWMRHVRRPVLVGLSCERFDDNMSAYLSRSDGARAFTRWYIRHIYGPPFDVHVANSGYTADELRDALPDRPPGFIRTLPMGVDAEAFGSWRADADLRSRLLARLGAGEEATLLFYAGRLSPEKNVGLLLETLRELVARGTADYRLVLAGDGPMVEQVRIATAATLAGRVLLCGNLDRDTLAACYATCDVFVHPNPREPFGIGPLEAMASGIPVVVPCAGGVLEYATSANAWLALPEPRAFADAVEAARLRDPDRLAAARETAYRYRWANVTRRFFDFYDTLAGSPLPDVTPVRAGRAR